MFPAILRRPTATFLAALATGSLWAASAWAVTPTLYVVEHTVNNDDVLAYNGSAAINTFDIHLDQATSLTLGPDGRLYVANTFNGGQVYPYDAITGAPLTPSPFVVYTGALANPQGMKFGPDGNLYIPDITQSNIQIFNGTTGAPVQTLNGPSGPVQPTDVAFDPISHALDVADALGIEQYSASSNDFFNIVLAATGGPSIPVDLAFGPDNKLYVLDSSTNSVFQYNHDGTSQSTFLSLPNTFSPNALAFGPDGLLYISGEDFNIPSNLQGEILRVSGGVATPYITGLNNPTFFAFAPVPEPASLTFAVAGLAALLSRRRKVARKLPVA